MSEMKLSFEKSRPGRRAFALPPLDVPERRREELIPPSALRKHAPVIPEMSEPDLVRHYTALSRRAFGVDNGFYPLGSCTMKYNPKLHEELAALPEFADIHPLQEAEDVQGALALMDRLSRDLCTITGMDAMSLSPAAGAHGEWAGLLLIAAYHAHRGDTARTTVLVPDTAHGTNPASASLAGFKVQSVPSAPDGGVDIEALRSLAGPDTAALMLTNPNTLGLFETRIEAMADIVHQAGGLLYYDGANMNAILGTLRPGDMGFDVVHLNLHKTFSTPHGGGGPGSGPVGCKDHLIPFLPVPVIERGGDGLLRLVSDRPLSIGRMTGFYGNFAVLLRACAYILTLGREGLGAVSRSAVLHANYMMQALSDTLEMPYPGPCMHEFVASARGLKEETGCSALDIAKFLLDRGMHPPTVYFPLTIPEAMMIEPTETESLETLDGAAAIFREAVEQARTRPEALHQAPVTTPVGRLDETTAARKPILRYTRED